MSDWNGDSRDRFGHGGMAARGRGGRPHAEPPLPPHMSPRPSVPGPRGHDGYDGYGPGEVYGGGRGRGGPGPGDYRRPGGGRRFKRMIVTLLVVILAISVGTYFWADSQLRREVDLGKVEDRPETGSGTNYLVVGSDSREGMTAQDKKNLHTGSAAGKRTDSMMILHVGSNGNTVISLPRDSWVTIPAFKGSETGRQYPATRNKLNAAYSMDGAPLLVRTVEYNTGLKIDHYAEIGFGGFAKIVDAVGGVEMNLPRAIKDEKSGADLRAGKQTLDGSQALAFVRTRYALAQSDLDRTKNQQKFLSALANQTATPSTLLNPFKLYPVMGAGLDTLVVDKDMSLWNVGSMFFAMKDIQGGEGKQMNMPIAGSAPMGSLSWDMPKVKQLVSQLKNDEKVTVKGNR
ncbi:LCP family protein [Streptomyces meridianus]|uniref:LCP family protein n=1 Tax=Streptomyces meridianus TaxID=2938945 RepID=A0ABT0XBU8_9ACTN|nr:LCP family protein [Streptomyces meridianus]MCM2579212.1 LCP family protein [Streptomyces meridianus]